MAGVPIKPSFRPSMIHSIFKIRSLSSVNGPNHAMMFFVGIAM